MRAKQEERKEDEGIRLNKYLSNAGIASRRKADELIAQGLVKVNGEIVLEMGHKVKRSDTVTFKGKKVVPGDKIYVLLNKPKDFITTTNDEKGRKTVLDLVKHATKERIYPVGRLDRNTTGLLLLTNDGELAQALAHPASLVEKVYAVELDKPLRVEDIQKIQGGLKLEDGIAQVDEVAFTDTKDLRQIGISLHIGKNRIVRRIFEHLGYKVKKLDRVIYAGLTKKDLPRSKWRLLTPKEVIRLKHFQKKSAR